MQDITPHLDMFSFLHFVNKLASHRNQPDPNHRHYSIDNNYNK